MVEALDIVRAEWGEGYRRLEATRSDPQLYRRLLEQVEVLTDELRKRVGSTFTLDELGRAYRDAERWSRAAIEERAPRTGWPTTVALAEDAAFHLYQRGALDYRP